MAGTTTGAKKTSMGGREHPDLASPSAIEKYLTGIHYPAGKEDLTFQAEDNRAPEDVLNRFEDKEYTNTIHVVKEIKNI